MEKRLCYVRCQNTKKFVPFQMPQYSGHFGHQFNRNGKLYLFMKAFFWVCLMKANKNIVDVNNYYWKTYRRLVKKFYNYEFPKNVGYLEFKQKHLPKNWSQKMIDKFFAFSNYFHLLVMTMHGCATDSQVNKKRTEMMRSWTRFYKTGDHSTIPKKSFDRYTSKTEGGWYRYFVDYFHQRVKNLKKTKDQNFYRIFLNELKELDNLLIEGYIIF